MLLFSSTPQQNIEYVVLCIFCFILIPHGEIGVRDGLRSAGRISERSQENAENRCQYSPGLV